MSTAAPFPSRSTTRRPPRSRAASTNEDVLSELESFDLLASLPQEEIRILDPTSLSVEHPLRKKSRLPWPRTADDGTPLGLDVGRHYKLIQRIALWHLRHPQTRAFLRDRIGHGCAGRELTAEDFTQELTLNIHHYNHLPSAFDPRKSQPATYITTRARQLLRDLTNKKDPSRSLEVNHDHSIDLADQRSTTEDRMIAIEDLSWGKELNFDM